MCLSGRTLPTFRGPCWVVLMVSFILVFCWLLVDWIFFGGLGLQELPMMDPHVIY